jgi:hypothetical protein
LTGIVEIAIAFFDPDNRMTMPGCQVVRLNPDRVHDSLEPGHGKRGVTSDLSFRVIRRALPGYLPVAGCVPDAAVVSGKLRRPVAERLASRACIVALRPAAVRETPRTAARADVRLVVWAGPAEACLLDRWQPNPRMSTQRRPL